MENALEKIHESIIQDLSKAIEFYKQGTSPAGDKIGASGKLPVSGQLNSEGIYYYSTAKSCFGVNLKFTAQITAPADGIFDIQIKSTDDSDNKYTDIKTGQAFSGTLKTNFWGTTQITISLQAKNLKNDTVNGILEYSY